MFTFLGITNQISSIINPIEDSMSKFVYFMCFFNSFQNNVDILPGKNIYSSKTQLFKQWGYFLMFIRSKVIKYMSLKNSYMDIFLIFLCAEKERHMALKHLSKQWIYLKLGIWRKKQYKRNCCPRFGKQYFSA